MDQKIRQVSWGAKWNWGLEVEGGQIQLITGPNHCVIHAWNTATLSWLGIWGAVITHCVTTGTVAAMTMLYDTKGCESLCKLSVILFMARSTNSLGKGMNSHERKDQATSCYVHHYFSYASLGPTSLS